MRESDQDTYGIETSSMPFAARQKFGLATGVLVFAIVLFTDPPGDMPPAAWRAAAAALLIAIWWMTEAIPIFATSLLPLVLLPMLDVVGIDEAAAPYANPLIFLFMGGFMIATAMERWDLHRRIALSIVAAVGTAPRRMVVGFMAASAFLSMWVSNTATAMMILPIGASVVGLARTDKSATPGNFGVVLVLAIAYACSIGGLSTLIGTPTNALFAAFMLEQYGVDVSFAEWMAVALPLALAGLFVIYFVLVHLVYPLRDTAAGNGRNVIRQQLEALGPMTRAEKMVAVVFTLVAVLWMSRPFLDNYVEGLSDPVIAVAGALVLFLLPVEWSTGTFVLNWQWAKRIPWGVLILFGGGLSLAASIQESGLAAWLGVVFSQLAAWPLLAMMLLAVTIIIFLTELTSNTATTAAFLPVLASVSIAIGQNPMALAVPAVLAASCAFMLPVATPPNAIVYGSGEVTIPQMARAGVVLNVSFMLLITALIYMLLPVAFEVVYGSVPDWAAGDR